ncbi:unnamed protein product [Lactuca virosa]|uniref:Peptide N-acetyl-beta-D-glucosaminyl asparaginase amidase A N-terminal domain-containing protein n=1 Tax=Lactuca virosa TaxID=75947 RepID=A0AAU9NP40_9ASTR|nr:unnamed protein product [Lactuca virosa]
MDSKFLPFVLLFLLLLLSFSIISAAIPVPEAVIFGQHLTSEPTTTNDFPPSTFSEVMKPIQLPNTKACSTLLLQHDFGNSYGSPPASVQYTRPSNCSSTDFTKIVLEWNATCKGRQLSRIIGIWLSGAELFRSYTAQPRARGIVWTVKKDITRYYSLLMSNKTQTLAVYLGNKVDNHTNGVYHVNVSIHYYPPEKKTKTNTKTTTLHVNSDHVFKEWADLIIPISQNLPPLNDALWLKIYYSNDVKTKQFAIPPNVYRVVLEVYVSVDEADQLWPKNFPNDYLSANNLTGYPGNGPFREVVVSLDGKIVGAVWPFTIVSTGAINPFLWRPISGIRAFDLPSYDIEITPLLGSLLNGKLHDIAFSVTNAFNVWLIDANLHVWLDAKSEKTKGMLLNQTISPLHNSVNSNFTGFVGTFVTSVQRSIKSTGWVETSFGKVVTESTQDFNLSNIMVMGHEGGAQTVNQQLSLTTVWIPSGQ